MPIYEFYCGRCNTLFNFFSRSVNTEKIPFCPRCKDVPLKRQMSVVARISRGKDAPGDEDLPPIDEARMERAMAMLMNEAERLDENDPRQAAKLMRKLSDAAGVEMGAGMEEALSRMERGEDPEAIEAELGEALTEEDPFLLAKGKGKAAARGRPPRVDDTLYDL
ncbi:MAG: zinc ribbon domain-containing protein [Deltaproteobacteria bacterium]|nr:zinc ribbon domain-containing protein [Deltaproteobacteria bacterium]